MRMILFVLIVSILFISCQQINEDQTIKVLNESDDEQLAYPIRENGKYKNPWDAGKKNSSFLNFILFSKDKSNIPSDANEINKILPLYYPTDQEINDFCNESTKDGKIRVIWIGHSTSLVNFEGKIILMDPVFSMRASPFSFLGPKRYRNPPIEIKKIPRLDIVLISHNHYDHLDEDSVLEINTKFGQSVSWFVPMGIKNWFESSSITRNVYELNWWETIKIDSFEIIFTPAQHWSGRGLFDRYETLWGGWIVKSKFKKIYFVGDTGYCPVFAQIGRKYGPFDVSFIPIGAYEPRSFMRINHCDPQEAVKIHFEIRSMISVAIHWGTFKLGREFYVGPKLELNEAMNKSSDKNSSFSALEHGKIYLF